jgi:hypothetical protein
MVYLVVQVESHHLFTLQEQRTAILKCSLALAIPFLLTRCLSLSCLLFLWQLTQWPLALIFLLSPKLYLSPFGVVGVEGEIRI